MPMVREFLDVFLEEFLGMPTQKEIEFLIELELRIALISCTPYRMT